MGVSMGLPVHPQKEPGSPQGLQPPHVLMCPACWKGPSSWFPLCSSPTPRAFPVALLAAGLLLMSEFLAADQCFEAIPWKFRFLAYPFCKQLLSDAFSLSLSKFVNGAGSSTRSELVDLQL